MSEKTQNRIVMTYIVIGILTYGIAFNRFEANENNKFISPIEGKALVGLMSGAFWPLYWSVQLTKNP